MKKVLSILLALVMAFSTAVALCMPSLAADTINIRVYNGSSRIDATDSTFALLPAGITANVDKTGKILYVRLKNYTGGALSFNCSTKYTVFVSVEGNNTLNAQLLESRRAALESTADVMIYPVGSNAVLNLNCRYNDSTALASDIYLIYAPSAAFMTAGAERLTVNANMDITAPSSFAKQVHPAYKDLTIQDTVFNCVIGVPNGLKNYSGVQSGDFTIAGKTVFNNEMTAYGSGTTYMFNKIIYAANFTGAAYYRSKGGDYLKSISNRTVKCSPYSENNARVGDWVYHAFFYGNTTLVQMVPESAIKAAFPAYKLGATLEDSFVGTGFVAALQWYDGKGNVATGQKVKENTAYTATATFAPTVGYRLKGASKMDLNALKPAGASAVSTVKPGNTVIANQLKYTFPGLKKPVAPVITVQPKDQAVKDSANPVFTLTATGDDLEYRWYGEMKNAVSYATYKLSDGDTFSGATTNKLTVKKALLPADVRNIYCVVSNASGSVKSNVVNFTRTYTVSSVAITGLDFPEHEKPLEYTASTSTAGCSVTDVSYTMFKKTLNSVETGDNVTVVFTVKAADGYEFVNGSKATWNGLTSVATVAPTSDTRRYAFEYRVPAPADGIAITSVSLNVAAPEIGETPATQVNSGSGGAKQKYTRYSVDSVKWEPADAAFRAGVAYTVVVSISVGADSYYKFTAEDTAATVNGNDAQVVLTDAKHAEVRYAFEALAAPVTEIGELVVSGLDAPDGSAPFDYDATVTNEAVQAEAVGYFDAHGNALASAAPGDTVRVRVSMRFDENAIPAENAYATWNGRTSIPVTADGKHFYNYGAGRYWFEFEYTIPNEAHIHVWSEEWAYNEDSHWHECDAAGCDVTENAFKEGFSAHTFGEWTVIQDATETDTGLEKRLCTVCGYEQNAVIPVKSHVHTLQKVDAKEATCVDDGNSLYYICTDCGKFFADEAAAEPLTAEQIAIPALGHEFTGELKADATGHFRLCLRCGEKGITEAHVSGEWIVDQPATKDAEGAQHKECAVCGYTTETGVIEKLPEDPTEPDETTEPAQLTDPNETTEPAQPTDPDETTRPAQPTDPDETTEPTTEPSTAPVEPVTDEGGTSSTVGEKFEIGDVNMDGRINSADARLTLRAAARVEQLGDAQLTLADVDGDGKIKAGDARTILRIAARLEPRPDKFIIVNV